MKKLYRFEWDCGRLGTVYGAFTATSEEVNNSIGEFVGLGEVLGKHSGIEGEINEKDFTLISENPDFVAEWDKATGGTIGVNPLEYL